MRTVILVGSMMIAGAIRPEKPAHEVVTFTGILLVCCMCMDILEFIHKMNKNKQNEYTNGKFINTLGDVKEQS